MKDCFKNFHNRLQDLQKICDESMQSLDNDIESEISNETNFIASRQNNEIISLCKQLVDILSDKESIARFRLEEPDILETAIKFAENILQGEQKVIFKGNDEIKRAKYLFNESFTKKYSTYLKPDDSILMFYLNAKKFKNKAKFLNHIFSDKVTFIDEIGEYVGDGDKRLEYLNYVIPTIEQPLAQITKQDGRIVYVKAFTYDDIKGDRPLKYMVVTKDEQGTINLVTSFSSQKIKDVIKIFNEAKEVQINIVPNDTFALSRGGTELKQSSTDETITDNTLNKAESESTYTRRKP